MWWGVDHGVVESGAVAVWVSSDVHARARARARIGPSRPSGAGQAVRWVTLTPRFAPAKVALLSMVLGWLNWGLGLVAGAILVRGVLDEMHKPQASAGLRSLSQGMLGAAGYTGLLVWHGGLSGSAPFEGG